MMSELWKAADSGDWCSFVKYFGGTNVDRKSFIVTVTKQWNDKPNRFQEPSGYQIAGLDFGGVVITTRDHQWRIEYQINTEAFTYRGVSNEENLLARGVYT